LTETGPIATAGVEQLLESSQEAAIAVRRKERREPAEGTEPWRSYTYARGVVTGAKCRSMPLFCNDKALKDLAYFRVDCDFD
jgi:hypothetical protein